jgi:copper(I)-binding protein
LRSLSLLAACALFASAAHAEVTASNAWVRATVPGQKTAAAYLTLRSTADARVVAVSTPAARKAELHTSMIMSGVAHMHGLDELKLPAGKSVELKPGADHVMLMDVPRALRAGETVPLALTIEDSSGKRSTLDVKAVVRPIAE